MARSCNNLGTLYQTTERYEEAEEKYKEALEIRRELSKDSSNAHLEDLAKCYDHLGEIYYRKEDFESALLMVEKVLKIFDELKIMKPYVYKNEIERLERKNN